MRKILFVCLGNICRSPAAEGVMKKLVFDAGLNHLIQIDSAGTGAWHAGSPPDARMQEHARARGYILDSIARQFTAQTDFEVFDYIVTMDESNYQNILAQDTSGSRAQKCHRMVKFCTVHDIKEVPDPYYHEADGFELVLDIVEDGCKGLLQQIRMELKV